MNDSNVTTPQNPAPAAQTIDSIKAQQNFRPAVAAGLAAALGGAVLWAVVTVVTKSKLGLMAIAVGYLVGQAIKATGKGIDKKFGYLGAACGLFGCVLGNILSALAFYAQAQDLSIMETINGLDMEHFIHLMTRFSGPMDILFYAIAVYEAYRFSFKYRLPKKK